MNEKIIDYSNAFDSLYYTEIIKNDINEII